MATTKEQKQKRQRDGLEASKKMVRREQIKAALRSARLPVRTALNEEQEERAANRLDGLRGKALADYIMSGTTTRDAQQDARSRRLAARQLNGGGAPSGPRPGGMTEAMVAVLKGRKKAMSASEVWAVIKERNLAPGLKGKTPEATVGAKLAVEAKKADGLFVRVEPGRFLLRKGGS